MEQRTRLEEIALADDYATRRLRDKNLNAFIQTFRFTAARRNQIEVSMSLNECFAPRAEAHRAEKSLTFKHPVWRWALAAMILIMLFATVWLVMKEPQMVKVPRRFLHSNAPVTPTPEVAHHAEHATEPGAHRDELPPAPSHEAALDVIVLDSAVSAENAPTVTLATLSDKCHLQLMLDGTSSATFLAELMTSRGELVYSQELTTAAGENRISFDVSRERLVGGDYQVRLTREPDGNLKTYYLRVR
ncbi:MAG TPA: hypothetical protein VGP81_08615 [Pyrinomonadaceae bacterium]|nr:hypothetical protein [Pyrinomonadaceae bacterium]